MRRVLRLIGCTVLAAAALAACGSDNTNTSSQATGPSTSAASEPPTAGAPAAGAGASSTLPDIEVVAVGRNENVALRSYLTSGRPALLWFWAPHCQFCLAEAPKVKAFAAEYAGRIDVLGVGAQDSLPEAEDFVDETATASLDMVWDNTGESWLSFQVTNQPTVIVVDGEGKVQKRWFRNFDEKAIVAAAGI